MLYTRMLRSRWTEWGVEGIGRRGSEISKRLERIERGSLHILIPRIAVFLSHNEYAKNVIFNII